MLVWHSPNGRRSSWISWRASSKSAATAPATRRSPKGWSLASLATVHKHILALETKHYVKRGFNQSRSLELAPKYYEEQRQHRPHAGCMEVPLLGRIAAGAPVEAIAGQDTLNFSDFAGDPDTYALQVRGESMIEDHICDGDYVLVEKARRRAKAISWWRWWTGWRPRSSASTGGGRSGAAAAGQRLDAADLCAAASVRSRGTAGGAAEVLERSRSQTGIPIATGHTRWPGGNTASALCQSSRGSRRARASRTRSSPAIPAFS